MIKKMKASKLGGADAWVLWALGVIFTLVLGSYTYTYSESNTTHNTIRDTAKEVETRVQAQLDKQEQRTKESLSALKQDILRAIEGLNERRR